MYCCLNLCNWMTINSCSVCTQTITKLTKNCGLSATQKQSLIIEGNSYNAWSLLNYSRSLFSMNIVSILNASLSYEFKRNKKRIKWCKKGCNECLWKSIWYLFEISISEDLINVKLNLSPQGRLMYVK